MRKPSETGPSNAKENIRHFKSSFIGKFSKFTEIKGKQMQI